MSDYEFCEAELEEGDGVPVHALTLCPKCNAWIDINLVLKEFPKFVFGVVKSVEAKKE
jgi:hypothetical protein